MKRDLHDKLVEWKNSKQRKPLILKGARQVGKTHILKAFGKAEYGDVAYFNFEEDPNLTDFFKTKIEAFQIIEKLSIYRNKKIIPHKTLIIFDEIQESNSALNSLKYFQEQANEYHVVTAGSLLGVQLSAPASFPVGKVNFLTLYPMHFYEFLSALGKKSLREYLEKINTFEALPLAFHEELIELLKKYYFIGGMPEVVASYCVEKDFNLVRQIQNEILDSYQLDFSKHAPAGNVMKILKIWNSIPSQLAKENKKFIFSAISKSARAREYEESIEWLVSSGLIYKSNPISEPKLPLDAYADNDSFKIFLLDVGLLGALTKLSAETVVIGNKIFTEFKGALVENYVAQEFKAHRNTKLYYWTSKNTAEVDFIITDKDIIFPLEVKAEMSSHKKSLIEYGKKYSKSILSRATLMNLKKNGEVHNYPLYALPLFPKLSHD